MSELVKKYVKVGIIVVVLAGIVLFVYSRKKDQPYQKGIVVKGAVQKTINVDATINPDVYANISSELPTRIKKIYVKENETVSKGDRLFDLDKKSISAQINKAKLAVERAELTEKKARRKWDVLKPEDKENIKKETEQSRQTLYELYAQADKTTVVSPLDGIVIKQNAREGEVAQGKIIQIINPESLQVEALVPEVDIAKVQKGQSVKIIFDAYPGEVIVGKVSNIDVGSTVKQNNTYFKVVVDIVDRNNLTILDGMNAEVDIEVAGKKNVLAVPRKFAKKDKQGYFVYILENDKGNESFGRQYFQEGLIGDDFIEVVTGLKDGEEIVLPSDE
jgi:RND family efflux transporter MFP subunit